MSAAFVNMPPPILMNSAIRLAPIPTPAMVIGSSYMRYRPVIASSAIAGIASPTVAPPRNAIAKVLPSPLPLRFAARTAAFTVIFRDMSPATADSVAPTANAMPFEGCRNAPIITDSAIATGTITFISLLRNAAAPTRTASDISIICFVPAGCLEIQPTSTPATINEAAPAAKGRISESSMYADCPGM